MNNKKVKFIVESGIIAAIYVLLTYLTSLFGMAYGEIQFRLSEMLCILPAFMPSAIPGLTIGCIIANLPSPLGLTDIIFGSLGTLIASVLIFMTKNLKIKGFPFLAPIINAVVNGIIVGLENLFLYNTTFSVFLLIFAEVAIGVIVVGYVFGIPLCKALDKAKIIKTNNKKGDHYA